MMKSPHPIFTLGCLISLTMTSCEQKESKLTEAQVQTITCSDISDHRAPFNDALAKINANCPQEYPEIVTPLPEPHDYGKFQTTELIGMLDSWNPCLREQAAKALAQRGTAVIAELKQGTVSENNKVRAGSATALASILKALPPEAQPTDITADFIRLTADPVLEVRVAALQALDAVAPQTTQAVMAVLALCDDPDAYLAQDAKLVLEKRFAPQNLPIEEITPGLKKAMQGSLPRGRGHITKIIERLKPQDQRRFIPELLAHLDWKPDRDTMFAAGGQAEAVKLLVKLEEAALIERLPALMRKNRGPGFEVCLEAAKAFGSKSLPIVEELKVILKDLEQNGKNAKVLPQGDLKHAMDDLKRAIIEIESL